MKTAQNLRVLLAVFFIQWCASAVLLADFIQPVVVQVSNGEAAQDALINGQGFDDPGVGTTNSVHNRLASEMWSSIGSIRESATFDLGQTVSLTQVYIWNYNVQDQTDIGMKDVEVQVSSDSDMATAKFNAIASITLAEGGDKAQTFDVVGTSVRLVRLKGLSNWGQGYTVGLAEVRFGSGVITGNVPSITLTSPLEGAEIALGSGILIDATVTDKDGAANVQKVEFYDGDRLLTNLTVSPYAFTYNGVTNGPHTFRAVVTDKTGKVSWTSVNVTVRELVADRIEKIDDTLNEGTGLGQIEYAAGTWNLAQGNAGDPRYLNNDHYNLGTSRTDYFLVRFKGVKIDLFATVASHHGTGWASIDSGAETKVIYKAAQRAEQVQVWSSPILANREHILKVRTGGDGVVTADRFDISVSDKPDVVLATVKEVVATFTNVTVTLEDAGTSVVVPATVKLTLDNVPVSSQAARTGTLTIVTHVPAAPFLPGSTHALWVEAKDTAGATITNLSTFTLPAPPFPLSGLGGPASSAGKWGIRQIWNAGRADAVSSAVNIALQAGQIGFTGSLNDTSSATVNFILSSSPGTAGLFPDPQPLPAEPLGLTAADFVVVARAAVRIPRAGDWTIGVHSDDGFALRFMGAPFTSVAGNGTRDDNFPEYMGFLVPGESITHGVLKGIAAGTYELEFIGFQRAAGAHFDIYAAEGEFIDDLGTDQWQLIGAPGGLEVVSGVKLQATGITKEGDQVTIRLSTPQPDAAHQLWESPDLVNWQNVPGAVFAKTGDSTMRVTVSGATGAIRFYRVQLP